MTECEKMTMFIEENYPMQYIIWEQEFYIGENDIDLTDEDVVIIE